MDPVYNMVVRGSDTVGWPKWYVKIRLTLHFSRCILINVLTLLKQDLISFLFPSFGFLSSVCHVGHPESGHSDCHHTENESKLGLKLSAKFMFIDQYAAMPALIWFDYDYLVGNLKTMSTSFSILIDYTFNYVWSIKYFCAILFFCLFDYFWLAISWLRWPRRPLNTYRKGFLM